MLWFVKGYLLFASSPSPFKIPGVRKGKNSTMPSRNREPRTRLQRVRLRLSACFWSFIKKARIIFKSAKGSEPYDHLIVHHCNVLRWSNSPNLEQSLREPWHTWKIVFAPLIIPHRTISTISTKVCPKHLAKGRMIGTSQRVVYNFFPAFLFRYHG